MKISTYRNAVQVKLIAVCAGGDGLGVYFNEGDRIYLPCAQELDR